MSEYISFVRRNLKGNNKANVGEEVEDPEVPVNEFEEGNIFLMPEDAPEEESTEEEVIQE